MLAQALVLLLVASAPRPASAVEVPSVEHGFKPERVFQVGELDHVRLLNGGLEIAIPLGVRYPVGGAGLSYGFTLQYGAQLWSYTQRWDQQAGGIMRTRAHPDGGANSGFGWRLSFGELWGGPDEASGKLCAGCYVDASGARHQFASSLHQGVTQVGVGFTTDGTFLRFRNVGAESEIEHPSGEVHRFDSQGRLKEMRDQFTGWVRVEYFDNAWRVHDSEGREHWVGFTDVPHYGKAVSSLLLSAFGGTNTASYGFTYQNVSVPRSCQDDDPQTSSHVLLPLLTSVSIPDGPNGQPGSSYSMPVGSYYVTPEEPCLVDSAARQGLLHKLVLPTQSSINWTFGPYFFPVPTDGSPDTDFPPTWLSAVTGVTSRTLLRPDGVTTEGVWTYGQSLPNGSASLESITSVTSALGDRTDHYFNVGQSTSATYGLSFTPQTTGAPERPDLFLSSRSYDCGPGGSNCVLKRSSFLKYDAAVWDPTTPFHDNPRVVATMTRFEDDGRWASTDHSSYDGLGHFRTAITSGNYGSGNARTVTTNFNPGSSYPGPVLLPGAGSPWVLGRYDRIDEIEGSVTARSEYCFETNGFLKLDRRLRDGTSRSGADLLAVYTPSAAGHRSVERYYGGDLLANVPSSAPCALTPVGPESYQIRNELSEGVLSSSQYFSNDTTALPFYSMRREIDERTGLVKRSFDISGIGTSYEYDLLGRLKWVKPDVGHDGWTEHVYTRATSATALAKLEIKRRDKGAEDAAVQAESAYDFDGFGRLTIESRRMPGTSVWTTRETKYNAQGLRASLSEWGNFAKKTTWNDYDPFGRPASITLPDSSTQNPHLVSFVYFGNREVRRTSRVGSTMSTPFDVQENDTTTKEIYDRQGRLYQVIEPSGNAGADVTTTYGYDVGNRLASATTTSGVTQTRSWTYDRRGLLTSEQHPELGASGNGTILYSRYDARGHATRKQDGPFDLTFELDRAERLTLVRETGGAARTLKQLSYYTQTGASLGKLQTAERHNYVSVLGTPFDGRVRETYEYEGRNGRVSNRRTELLTDSSTVPNEIWDVGFEYTPLGEVDLVDYPVCSQGVCTGGGGGSPRVITHSFSRGWLTAVVPSSGSNWATINYHSNGAVNQISHRNGVAVVHGIDPNAMSRPASIGTTGVAGGNNWFTGSYRYDGSGNVVEIGDSIYLYDLVNRVTSASIVLTPAFAGVPSSGFAPLGLDLVFADGFESGTLNAWGQPTSSTEGMQTFTYDPFGNLVNIGGDPGRPISVSASTNRLIGESYDAAGNMTSWNVPNNGGTNSYAYGPFHETWRQVTSNQEWVHLYSVDDERIFSYQVTGGLKSRWTLRGLDNRVLREYVYDRGTSTGLVERDNIYRGTGPLLASATPAGDRHFHVDHLGTPRLITDAAGAQIAFHAYFPYGEEATLPNQNTIRYKFTGHERDLADPNTPSDDHDYMHARVTNPQLGRFLSIDPVGGSPRAPQSWNRYGYVRGNPLKYTDPTGEFITAAMIADKASGLLEKTGVAASDAVSDGSLVGALIAFQISNVVDFAQMGLDALRAGDAIGTAIGSGAAAGGTALAAGQDALRVAGLVAPAAGVVRSATARTAVAEGTELFRVFGGEAQAGGRYFSTVNPNSVSDFRVAAGIFPENTGRFVLEGTLQNTDGVLFGLAKPGPGGVGGGISEVFVPNPAVQIRVVRVSGANPEF